MGTQGSVGDHFRNELRSAREGRGWSQALLSGVMNAEYDIPMYPSTIAKIESGERDVRINELYAFADLFEVSTDVLLGRHGNSTDVVWAMSRLTTNAQRIVADLSAIRTRLSGDLEDMRTYAKRERREGAVEKLGDLATDALGDLESAQERVSAVAGQFPLPGVKSG